MCIRKAARSQICHCFDLKIPLAPFEKGGI